MQLAPFVRSFYYMVNVFQHLQLTQCNLFYQHHQKVCDSPVCKPRKEKQVQEYPSCKKKYDHSGHCTAAVKFQFKKLLLLRKNFTPGRRSTIATNRNCP